MSRFGGVDKRVGSYKVMFRRKCSVRYSATLGLEAARPPSLSWKITIGANTNEHIFLQKPRSILKMCHWV